jgi:biotin carboxyl carrier protein
MQMKYNVTLNGRTYEVEVEHGKAMLLDEYAANAPAAAPVAAAPAAAAVAAPAAAPAGVTVSGGQSVTAPMPGNILKVAVSVGQSVKEGDLLCVLEAMKMENEIYAPCAGTVSAVPVAKGSTVNTGDLLVAIGGTVVAAAPAPAAAPVAAPAAPAAAPAPAAPAVTAAGEAVKAPMPGNILKVNVSAGQAVKEGEVLVVLEAMKMENEIMAPKAGTVTQVLVQKGSTVNTDAPLVVIG